MQTCFWGLPKGGLAGLVVGVWRPCGFAVRVGLVDGLLLRFGGVVGGIAVAVDLF